MNIFGNPSIASLYLPVNNNIKVQVPQSIIPQPWVLISQS